MAGGSGLQSLEGSPADARCENAATLAVVVVDCKKRRRESTEVPQMSAVHYCMLAEFQIANIAEASWGSGGTLQSPMNYRQSKLPKPLPASMSANADNDSYGEPTFHTVFFRASGLLSGLLVILELSRQVFAARVDRRRPYAPC